MMNQKKETLNVLHEKDLKQFLINFNLYDDFQEKKILCKYCENPVSLDNICAIILIKGKIDFVCDKEQCYYRHLYFHEEEEKEIGF